MVQDSVSAAELEANTKNTEIYVGVPGERIRVLTAEAEIETSGNEITEEDINTVQDMAAEKLHIGGEDDYVMHRSPAWFSVNDGKKTMEPMGEKGGRLRACVSFILASMDFIDDIREIMGSTGHHHSRISVAHPGTEPAAAFPGGAGPGEHAHRHRLSGPREFP